MNQTFQNPKCRATAEREGRCGFFLVGPTASGKSAVAQRLAESQGTAILSADSMLVYRGMDLGTDKPGPAERRQVPYYGLDLALPNESFSVGHYLERAAAELRGEDAGQTVPLIVAGGTGLYVNALIHGLGDVPPGSPERRAVWENRLKSEGVCALQSALSDLSPVLYQGLSDKDNPRRLIRALELAEAGVEQFPTGWEGARTSPPLVGIRRGADALNGRIEERVRNMFRSGLVEEVRGLLERYGALAPTAERAIGYAEAMAILSGQCGEMEAVERTVLRTRKLAKRQRTWFAHQVNVEWVEVTSGMDDDAIARKVAEEWGKHGARELSV